MAAGANCLKVYLLLLVILILIGIILDSKTYSINISLYLKDYIDAEQSGGQSRPLTETPSRSKAKTKYLSYQPPGNGWNNQRIALENALVLAKLLNRTLVVHPMAPHGKGNKLKVGNLQGYEVYNMLTSRDLLPLSEFLDLDLLSKIVPVKEIVTSHPQFVRDYSHLTWRNVCHSPGNGFWVDQIPQTATQEELLVNQKFSSLGKIWRARCKEEKRSNSPSIYGAIIRFVSELATEDSDMLYFERGTLFGMQIRFMSIERARAAQEWVVQHVQYSKSVWETVHKVADTFGSHYNAIQVRRKNHMDSKLPPSFWLDKMMQKDFERNVSVYVATNGPSEQWFETFRENNYKIVFSTDLQSLLSFPNIKKAMRNDFLAIHEQCICEQAARFIGSPASTFTALILRLRGEVRVQNGLMLDTLHTYWVGHKRKKTRTQNN